MKRSKFSDAQVAMIPQQADDGAALSGWLHRSCQLKRLASRTGSDRAAGWANPAVRFDGSNVWPG